MFENITSRAAPLLRANIDTDAIIPSREMKMVSKTGLSAGLFAGWRYLEGRTENPDFVLNKPEYKEVQILLAGENFGCGSSREHAVWALKEYGFLVIVAPSYGEIFYGNCLQNGVLPITLPLKDIQALAENGQGITVNLRDQTIGDFEFEINDQHKIMLLQGLDAIDLSLKLMPEINAFEKLDELRRPWAALK